MGEGPGGCWACPPAACTSESPHLVWPGHLCPAQQARPTCRRVSLLSLVLSEHLPFGDTKCLPCIKVGGATNDIEMKSPSWPREHPKVADPSGSGDRSCGVAWALLSEIWRDLLGQHLPWQRQLRTGMEVTATVLECGSQGAGMEAQPPEAVLAGGRQEGHPGPRRAHAPAAHCAGCSRERPQQCFI